MDQEAKRGPGRPPTGMAKPKRNVRIGDVWDRCAVLAEQDGESMTELVDTALQAEERRRLRRRRRDEAAS